MIASFPTQQERHFVSKQSGKKKKVNIVQYLILWSSAYYRETERWTVSLAIAQRSRKVFSLGKSD